ncbi:MAG: hypothetical protein AB7D46_10660, partial [Flavobacteriaceae bacterium]
MKNKILLFLLMIVSSQIWGQTTCLENDDSWTGSGLVTTDGQGCAGEKYVFNGSGDTATSPIVTNPEELKFKLRRSGNDTPWSMVVEISTNPTHTTFTTVQTINSISNSACGSISYTTIDLSSYMGERRVRFRDTRGSGSHERTVSDVTLSCTAPITCSAPDTPNGSISGTTPACVSTILTYTHGSGQPQAGIAYYWQTESTGTSTDSNTSSTLNVTS